MNISLILLSHNRSSDLERLFSSIVSQDINTNRYEIIVSDDGSCDSTPAVVKKYQLQNKGIKFLQKPKSNVSLSRNAGVKAATNGLILFLADDYILDCPDTLSKIISIFEKYQPDILKIKIASPESCNYLNAANHAYNSFNSDILLAYAKLDKIPCNEKEEVCRINHFNDSTGCIYKKPIFDQVGLYGNYDKGEDTEFATRVCGHHLNIYYCPSIKLVHNHSYHWYSFLQYHFQRGKGVFALEHSPKYKNLFSSRCKTMSYYFKQLYITPSKIIKSNKNAIKYLPIFFLILLALNLGVFYYMLKSRPRAPLQ